MKRKNRKLGFYTWISPGPDRFRHLHIRVFDMCEDDATERYARAIGRYPEGEADYIASMNAVIAANTAADNKNKTKFYQRGWNCGIIFFWQDDPSNHRKWYGPQVESFDLPNGVELFCRVSKLIPSYGTTPADLIAALVKKGAVHVKDTVSATGHCTGDYVQIPLDLDALEITPEPAAAEVVDAAVA